MRRSFSAPVRLIQRVVLCKLLQYRNKKLLENIWKNIKDADQKSRRQTMNRQLRAMARGAGAITESIPVRRAISD
jgi:hypothetical protein